MTPTTCTESSTLADIALAAPAAAAILEKNGLDYCCRGGRSLKDACAAKGISAESVLSSVRAALERGVVPDPATDAAVPLSAILDEIEATHHVYTRTALERIGGLTRKVVERHGASHPEFVQLSKVVTDLGEELEPHMIREERVLFPYIRALESPAEMPFTTVASPIRVMTEDHESAGALLETLARLTDDFGPGITACLTVRALYGALAELRQDLMRHIAVENHIVFPRAIALEARRSPTTTPTGR